MEGTSVHAGTNLPAVVRQPHGSECLLQGEVVRPTLVVNLRKLLGKKPAFHAGGGHLMLRARCMSGVCISYRVDFASGAWSELGMLERAVFRQLAEKLRDIAAEAPRFAGASDVDTSSAEPARLQCGEATAFYEIDHQTCSVLVVKVVPGSSPVAA
jgi:hypothetical protein